jgi:hypothetical protein
MWVDLFTRECLAIDVGQSLKGEDVARVLTAIAETRGLPRTVKSDNCSEFISKVMDKWAYERGVELDFSRPGKPTDNANVESFSGRLRQQCLNASWFMSLDDARQRSASAAKEIKDLIGASVQSVEAGGRLVGQAGQTMGGIVSSVQRVSDIIGEITAAAGEQSSGIAQVNSAVNQLDQMTQQNADWSKRAQQQPKA